MSREEPGSGWQYVKIGAIASLAAVGAVTVGRKVLEYFAPDLPDQMRRLIVSRALQVAWRRKAVGIIRGIHPDDLIAQLRALQSYTREHIQWVRDPAVGSGDYAAPPEEAEAVGGGDCDCLAVHLGTLLVAVGHPVKVAFLPAERPTHAILLVELPYAQFVRLPPLAQHGFNSTRPNAIWVPVDPQAPDIGVVDANTEAHLGSDNIKVLDCV